MKKGDKVIIIKDAYVSELLPDGMPGITLALYMDAVAILPSEPAMSLYEQLGRQGD